MCIWNLLYLCDIWQTDGVGHNAHACDEDLPPLSEHPGELVHQSSNEALHRAELQIHITIFRIFKYTCFAEWHYDTLDFVPFASIIILTFYYYF